jgi:hypothetical protein
MASSISAPRLVHLLAAFASADGPCDATHTLSVARVEAVRSPRTLSMTSSSMICFKIGRRRWGCHAQPGPKSLLVWTRAFDWNGCFLIWKLCKDLASSDGAGVHEVGGAAGPDRALIRSAKFIVPARRWLGAVCFELGGSKTRVDLARLHNLSTQCGPRVQLCDIAAATASC